MRKGRAAKAYSHLHSVISILDFGLAILDRESQNFQGFRQFNL